MHPFPPPPPISMSSSWANAMYILSLLLVMGTIAGALLRPHRKTQHYDISIWIGSGLVMTAEFIWISSASLSARDMFEWFVLMLWAVVAFGCWVNWFKQRDQARPSESNLEIGAMVLVAFVLVLGFLAMPPSRSRTPGNRSMCRYNLHNIGLALHNYHDAFDSFPAQIAGEPPMSWRVEILPYLDEQDLRSHYNDSSTWDSPWNLPVARQAVPHYTCPSTFGEFRSFNGLWFTSYAVAVGEHSLWRGDRAMSLGDATDGTSNTVLVIEACGQQIIWTEPRDVEVVTTPIGINLPGLNIGESDGVISSFHMGGALVTMADGSVRFVSERTDPSVLEAILTADGGEQVPAF